MTNESRIIQIIPAPADMWVKGTDSETGETFHTRVICLALMEDTDGFRYVRAMDITEGDGYIEPISERKAMIVWSAKHPDEC